MAAWEGVSFLAHCFQAEAETSVRYDDWGFLLLLSTKIFFLFIQIIQCYVLFSAIIIYVVNSPPKNCLLLENYQLNFLEDFQTLSV